MYHLLRVLCELLLERATRNIPGVVLVQLLSACPFLPVECVEGLKLCALLAESHEYASLGHRESGSVSFARPRFYAYVTLFQEVCLTQRNHTSEGIHGCFAAWNPRRAPHKANSDSQQCQTRLDKATGFRLHIIFKCSPKKIGSFVTSDFPSSTFPSLRHILSLQQHNIYIYLMSHFGQFSAPFLLQ